jgi:hypothetical protein
MPLQNITTVNFALAGYAAQDPGLSWLVFPTSQMQLFESRPINVRELVA